MQQDLFSTGNKILAGAEFSSCRSYRYALWRIWDVGLPLVMFVGLNPSTANESENDATIKSVCRIAKSNNYGGVYMMNCFAYISTDPYALAQLEYTPLSEHYIANEQWLKQVAAQCKDVVFAWGNFSIIQAYGRDDILSKMFPQAMALQLNKNGSPKHPLYCRKDTKFIKCRSGPGLRLP